MNTRILLIEDDLAVGQSISELFEAHDMSVEWEQDGIKGLSLGVRNTYDLMIVDINLPSISGLDICKKLREQARVTTPILILTAQGTLCERLEGFEAGADDYICKPFETRELLARVKSIVRRANMPIMPPTLCVGDLKFNLATIEVTRAGKVLDMPDKTRQLLRLLMQASPRPVPRDELAQCLWGDNHSIDAVNALRQQLHYLRAAVDRPFSFPMIRNVPKSQVALLAPDPWRYH